MIRHSTDIPRRHPARRVAVALLLISAIGFVLPVAITGRLDDVLQIIAPFQDGASRLLDAGRSALPADAESVDAANQREVEALKSIVNTLAARNRRLALENEALTRVRHRGLGVRGRLIPARVIADDSAHWRDSKLILGGAGRGIDDADGVVSNHVTVDVAREDGIDDGMALLASESLIGVIESTGGYTSRVKLLSDPQMRMPISIGRVQGDSFATVDAAFWLVGRGHGRIEVREVHHQYIDNAALRVGDVVLTRDDEPRLPPSITIGAITEIAPDPDNNLLFILKVQPNVDLPSVRRVYVVDTESPFRAPSASAGSIAGSSIDSTRPSTSDRR